MNKKATDMVAFFIWRGLSSRRMGRALAKPIISRHRKAAMGFASLYPSCELSEEAAVAVFSNDIEEFFNRSRFQVRLVTVPL